MPPVRPSIASSAWDFAWSSCRMRGNRAIHARLRSRPRGRPGPSECWPSQPEQHIYAVNRLVTVGPRMALVRGVFLSMIGEPMPLKINVGLSRKIGEANYGSRGASVHVELEADSTLVSEPAKFQQRIREVFSLVRASLAEELNCNANGTASSNGRNGDHV